MISFVTAKLCRNSALAGIVFLLGLTATVSANAQAIDETTATEIYGNRDVTSGEYYAPPAVYVDNIIVETDEGDFITGSFTALNRSTEVVGDLTYRIDILSPEVRKTPSDELTLDTSFKYDSVTATEIFALLPGTEKTINYGYDPSILPAGEYRLQIQLLTEHGREFGWGSEPLTIAESDATYLELITGTIGLSRYPNELIPPLSGPNVLANETVELRGTVRNASDTPITFQPVVSVHEFSLSREAADSITLEEQIIPARSSVELSIPVTVSAQSGVYAASLSLQNDAGQRISPISEYRWIVQGTGADIVSSRIITLRTMAGEAISVQVDFTGPPDAKTDLTGELSIKVLDEKGVAGSFTSPEFVPLDDAVIESFAEITLDRDLVGAPTLDISLVDENGETLVTYEAEYPLSDTEIAQAAAASVAQEESPESPFREKSRLLTAFIVLGILILIIFIILLVRTRRRKKTPKLVVGAILLTLGIGVSAWTSAGFPLAQAQIQVIQSGNSCVGQSGWCWYHGKNMEIFVNEPRHNTADAVYERDGVPVSMRASFSGCWNAINHADILIRYDKNGGTYTTADDPNADWHQFDTLRISKGTTKTENSESLVSQPEKNESVGKVAGVKSPWTNCSSVICHHQRDYEGTLDLSSVPDKHAITTLQFNALRTHTFNPIEPLTWADLPAYAISGQAANIVNVWPRFKAVEPIACNPQDRFATSVVDSSTGGGNGGVAADVLGPPDRTIAGSPDFDNTGTDYGFVTVGFSGPIPDGPGNDVRVWYMNFPVGQEFEVFDILASENGGDFVVIADDVHPVPGQANHFADADLATGGLSSATQIMIRNTDTFATSNPGPDIDAIESLHPLRCTGTPQVDGLVAYYPLDEGLGAQAADHSGHGNDLGITGATFDSCGAPTPFNNPYALRFDGVDDFARILQSPNVDTSVKGIAFWVKSDVEVTPSLRDTTILQLRDVQNTGPSPCLNGDYWGLSLGDSTGGLDGETIATYSANSCIPHQRTGLSTQILPANKWHHIAVTYSETRDAFEGYVDGVKQPDSVPGYYVGGGYGTVFHDGFDPAVVPTTIALAKQFYPDQDPSSSAYFDGVLDDVRLYDRPLTDQEIAQLAQNTGQSCSSTPTSCQPSTIMAHEGDTDPETEGWIWHDYYHSAGWCDAPHFAKGAVNDGEAAWSIRDQSICVEGHYNRKLTAAEIELMQKGWAAKTRVNVTTTLTDLPRNGAVTPLAVHDFNGRRYRVFLGRNTAGDPMIHYREAPHSVTGPVETLTGYGPGYHDFEMRWDPLDGAVDVYVDGNLVKENWTGSATCNSCSGTATRIQWGSNATRLEGNANYAAVSLTATCGAGDEQCRNLIDDDGDGLIDCADPGCYPDGDTTQACDPNDDDETDPTPQCSDGIDNDGDGKIDCDDAGCHLNDRLDQACDPTDTTENELPIAKITASAGQLNDPINISAAASRDPEGGVLTYAWEVTKPGGTTLTFTEESKSFPGDEEGTWIIRLTVTDSGGATGKASTSVRVLNTPVVALISTTGSTVNNPVTLDGSQSTPLGDITSFDWTVKTPSGADVPVADGAISSFTPTTEGTYVITLTVTDNKGRTDTGTLDLTISKPSFNPGTVQEGE